MKARFGTDLIQYRCEALKDTSHGSHVGLNSLIHFCGPVFTNEKHYVGLSQTKSADVEELIKNFHKNLYI